MPEKSKGLCELQPVPGIITSILILRLCLVQQLWDYTSEQAAAYIEKILDDPKRFYSIIEVKPSRDAIGIVSFLFRAEYACPDLGFALLPRFEKKGYAEEASRRYLEELFHEGLHPKIIAIAKPENQKSVRLLERLGFSYETTETSENAPLVIYSLEPA